MWSLHKRAASFCAFCLFVMNAFILLTIIAFPKQMQGWTLYPKTNFVIRSYVIIYVFGVCYDLGLLFGVIQDIQLMIFICILALTTIWYVNFCLGLYLMTTYIYSTPKDLNDLIMKFTVFFLIRACLLIPLGIVYTYWRKLTRFVDLPELVNRLRDAPASARSSIQSMD